MIAQPPAIVAPADADLYAWISSEAERAAQPSAADLDEMALADALRCPAVRRLLLAARAVSESDGRDGMYALHYALVGFTAFPNRSFADPDETPAREITEQPPF